MATTKKYLTVAFCDGVGFNPSRGSVRGISPGRSFSGSLWEPKYQTIPPTPASSSTKLMTLQTTVAPVG